MANLADIIENFIKEMFREMPGGILEIQRNELASRFGCAPSQINYVLTTRFTLERGYFVESRRGGGGYIRIKKLKIREDEFLREIIDFIGDSISGTRALAVINRLWEEGIVTEREAHILRAAVNRHNLHIGLPERDKIRAGILKAMITTIMDFQARKGGNLS
ncbi:CtsR family transcriptional regulator [Thermoanaerobacterium sp. DL9XJH110]|uniref:CtsR family transcriptional regulator n=1 Tax=Thermoanaerobacterium sp. DL9XJH110 TaxID=3386643 RepID=UPI003BB81471